MAEAIVKARTGQPIQTTGQLQQILIPLLGRDREKKDLARAFQALRIEVNHEMDALRDLLVAATELLAPKGRLVVMSYHSLEDRIVKNVMRAGNIDGEVQQDIFGNSHSPLRPVGKPIVPTAEEQATGRAHRIGQKKKVEVLRLVVHHSIEEQVLRMSIRKRRLFDQLITPGEEMPTRLSEKDILSLFDADRK